MKNFPQKLYRNSTNQWAISTVKPLLMVSIQLTQGVKYYHQAVVYEVLLITYSGLVQFLLQQLMNCGSSQKG
jgi:hypothetical protein